MWCGLAWNSSAGWCPNQWMLAPAPWVGTPVRTVPFLGVGVARRCASFTEVPTTTSNFSTYETVTAYLDAKNIEVKDFFVEEYVSDLTSADDASLGINIFALPKR